MVKPPRKGTSCVRLILGLPAWIKWLAMCLIAILGPAFAGLMAMGWGADPYRDIYVTNGSNRSIRIEYVEFFEPVAMESSSISRTIPPHSRALGFRGVEIWSNKATTVRALDSRTGKLLGTERLSADDLRRHVRGDTIELHYPP